MSLSNKMTKHKMCGFLFTQGGKFIRPSFWGDSYAVDYVQILAEEIEFAIKKVEAICEHQEDRRPDRTDREKDIRTMWMEGGEGEGI